jgi:hypothetical protein
MFRVEGGCLLSIPMDTLPGHNLVPSVFSHPLDRRAYVVTIAGVAAAVATEAAM